MFSNFIIFLLHTFNIHMYYLHIFMTFGQVNPGQYAIFVAAHTTQVRTP